MVQALPLTLGFERFRACYFSLAVSFCGSWARTIAPNITTQPMISRVLNFCPKIIQPARTEIQDSRLRIREATVGFIFFWPTIWRV